MHRLAACALLLAAAVVAAPAPKPRLSAPWATGWDKPEGDGRFDRKGDRLTAVVRGRCEAKLLRDVQGDFTVQVRVGGDLCRPDEDGGRWAGFLVEAKGGTVVELFQYATWEDATPARVLGRVEEQGTPRFTVAHFPERPSYLRLERRQTRLVMSVSWDGKNWAEFGKPQDVKLPQKVKLGVLVGTSVPGRFKATLDQFQLTPLDAAGRPQAGR